MAYIGSTPTSQNFTSGTDYFSGTGSQTAFTLTRIVNSVNDIEVVINNVVQQPSTAYTLSGTTITFTSAPSSGTNNIYVRYLATNMQSFTVPANSITRTQLDSNLQAGFQGRNKIINGHMGISQSASGASVTQVNTAALYPVDRFAIYGEVSSKFTGQQSSTAPAGFINSLLITSSSTYTVGVSEFFYIRQRIEGLNITDLGWGTSEAKTVTLSFWVRSSLTGTFGGVVRNSAGNRSYPFSYTISSANTYEQKLITIVGDTTGTWLTTNGTGIELDFNLGAGSSVSTTANAWAAGSYFAPTGATSVVGTSGATFYITGVQLEEGTTSTSFERESYSVTLQKCQRYYAKIQNDGSGDDVSVGFGAHQSTTVGMYVINYPVTMRAEPTASISSLQATDLRSWSANASLSSISAGYNTATLFTTFAANGATGAAVFLKIIQNTSGFIALSSEL